LLRAPDGVQMVSGGAPSRHLLKWMVSRTPATHLAAHLVRTSQPPPGRHREGVEMVGLALIVHACQNLC